MSQVVQPLKWHEIPGFSGYRVCDDGLIWSLLRRPVKPLKPDVRPVDGRKRYTLRNDNGQFERKYGSYFSLLATVGPRPAGMEACHNDGDCTNDSPSNLRWDTPSANKNDQKAHGTSPCGDRSPTVKLNWGKVLLIRYLRLNGASLSRLARMFDVTEANVSAICNHKTWKLS